MKYLQRRRQLKRWTRAELARRARMNASTVGLIEAGRLVPYSGQLRKLARALGVAADQLLADVEGDAVQLEAQP